MFIRYDTRNELFASVESNVTDFTVNRFASDGYYFYYDTFVGILDSEAGDKNARLEVHTLEVNLVDRFYNTNNILRFTLGNCAEQLRSTSFFLIVACPSEGKIEVRFIHSDLPVYFY